MAQRMTSCVWSQQLAVSLTTRTHLNPPFGWLLCWVFSRMTDFHRWLNTHISVTRDIPSQCWLVWLCCSATNRGADWSSHGVAPPLIGRTSLQCTNGECWLVTSYCKAVVTCWSWLATRIGRCCVCKRIYTPFLLFASRPSPRLATRSQSAGPLKDTHVYNINFIYLMNYHYFFSFFFLYFYYITIFLFTLTIYIDAIVLIF